MRKPIGPTMTWIGVSDQSGGWFSPERSAPAADAPGGLLPRGALMLEARVAPVSRPQIILSLARSHPWPGSLSLQVLPDRGIVLTEAQGTDARSAVLPFPYTERTDSVRLSWSWDAPARTGRLTIERPEADLARWVDLPGSRPMLVDDLRKIMTRPERRRMGDEVIFAAVSDRVEPVGPMPSLTADTPILTDRGERRVCELRRGDLVRTERGNLVPVLGLVRRTVPARGSFHPVRLRAGYFGLTRDIVVAPCQQLVLRGADVEYMFGCEAVLAPARHLLDNVSARPARGPDMVTYYQLVLPGHEPVIAAGCVLDSLFVGRLRRKPAQLAASILAPFERSLLPEHARPVWPVLKPFEAITIAAERAA